MKCDRCKGTTDSLIGSMFDTTMICPACKHTETQHAKYEEAVAVELAEVRKGNFNYPGIGLPDDLIVPPTVDLNPDLG